MKYTIPYDDKITLPSVKKIENIKVDTDHINYDRKELTGEVIITGDYSVDNSQDIMEFTHDIPVSFLIDDDSISPQINITNFKYELIPSRGIEVMFELDIVLIEEEEKEEELIARDKNQAELTDQNSDEDEDIKEFQQQIDDNLDAALNKKPIEQEGIKPREDELEDEKKRFNFFKKKEPEAVNTKNKKVAKKEPTLIQDEEEEKPAKQAKEDNQPVTPKTIKEEEQESPYMQELEEEMGEELEPEDYFTTSISSSLSEFDPGFIPRDKDKYTTYKIILVEDNDNIDELLEQRNLSKALICSEYNFENKIVLKLENE